MTLYMQCEHTRSDWLFCVSECDTYWYCYAL